MKSIIKNKNLTDRSWVLQKKRFLKKIVFCMCLITMVLTMVSVAYADKNEDYSVTVSMPTNEDGTSAIYLIGPGGTRQVAQI